MDQELGLTQVQQAQVPPRRGAPLHAEHTGRDVRTKLQCISAIVSRKSRLL